MTRPILRTVPATLLLASTLGISFSTLAHADCACRLKGARLPLGTLACMEPDGHPALYECAMNLNITTWRRVGESCPTAIRLPAVPTAVASAGGH
jgi:hypothetical protein